MKRFILSLLGLLLALSGCRAPVAPAVPVFSDLDLVGYYHREPRVWSAERFGPHVSFVDAAGQEQWLFEAFLFIEAHDPVRDRMMTIAPSGLSAGRDSWEDQLEIWLGPEGSVAQLEQACADAAARIGDPPHKRYVVVAVPDAVMLENFADKRSSTCYWGALDGVAVDFATVEGQLKALRWYIDEARARFAALDCRYLELGGFYVVSEDLPVAYGETEAERLNCAYKRWESIVPALAEDCHAAGQGLYWIPYHMAPGYKYWKRLGFDQAWMQPNYYWDLHTPGAHPFEKTIDAVKEYGMGMELEFEYSLVSYVMAEMKEGPDAAGKMVFTETDVPALKEQFRDYLRRFKEAGLYGVAPVALYSGSNALTQLATSPDPSDVALYREICTFIAGSPLRTQ